MALTPIGQGVGIDSAILDAHQVGDLMVAHAFSRSIGVPVLPAAEGWIEIDQVGTTTSSGITAYKIATSTNELSGTWTNATSLVISIHRPAGEVSIGASSLTLGSSNSILDWAELVLENTDGTSTVLAVQSHRSSNAEPLNAPNGSTLRATYENPFNSMSAIYELSDTASWPATTTDTETSANSHNTGAIEIKETPPVIVITEDNTPVVSNTDITLTLTGAGASQLTGIIEQIQGTIITSIPATSWADTEVVGNTVEITSSQYKYGTHQFKVTNDSGDFATTSRPVSPPTTHDYVDILHAATIYDRIDPVAVGNQVEYQSNLYIDGVVTAHTITINDDGTYTLQSGTGGTIPNGTYTFSFKVFDHTDNTWGTPATQTVVIGEGVSTSTSQIVMTNTDVPDGIHSFKIYNDSTNTLIEVKDITFSGGSATTTVAVTPGTPFLVFSKGNNPPTTGMAYDGVTQ